MKSSGSKFRGRCFKLRSWFGEWSRRFWKGFVV